MLTHEVWVHPERFFGLHSFDFISLDSIARRIEAEILCLMHTQCDSRGSVRVNLIANIVRCLPGMTFIRFRLSFCSTWPFPQHFLPKFPWCVHCCCAGHSTKTVLVAWATLQDMVVDRLLVDRKGSGSELLFPSRHCREWTSPVCLQWDLWAFRCVSKNYPASVGFKTLESCLTLSYTPSIPWYPNAFDENFCQACGSGTCPCLRQRSALEQQLSEFLTVSNWSSLQDRAHLSVDNLYNLVRDAVFFFIDFFTRCSDSDSTSVFSSSSVCRMLIYVIALLMYTKREHQEG